MSEATCFSISFDITTSNTYSCCYPGEKPTNLATSVAERSLQALAITQTINYKPL